MATSFQLYIDKENNGAPLKNREGFSQSLGLRGVGLTPNVKSFAGNDSSLARSGPRSALKDVNNVTPQAPQKNKKVTENVKPIQELFKVPAPKDNDFVLRKKSEKQQKSKVPPLLDGRHRVVHKTPDPLPEREHLHIFNENELKPRQDPDYIGVVEKIRRWRPPCFFGGRQDSDSEDEVIDDLLDIPPPAEPEIDSDPIELVDIDEVDIPIPNIDKDLPIPFLDDSLDIEPNLGTLEIYQSSTPVCLSPCVKK